jgi:hypothetical protein
MTTNFNATRHPARQGAVNFNQIYGTARVNNVTSGLRTPSAPDGRTTRHPGRVFVAANQYDHDVFQKLDLVVAGLGLAQRQGASTTLYWASNCLQRTFQGLMRLLKRVSATPPADVGGHQHHPVFPMFPNMSNPGEYRVNFDLGAVTALNKWLGWQVSASDRYLSNPLFGRQRNDLLISTGLRLSFAK